MRVSKKGLDLIKKFEGCKLRAYKALKSEKYYTIGYGHYGADVHFGDTITPTRADELLAKDVESFEKMVSSYMKKYELNQNQFDALVSFAYNVGTLTGLTKCRKRDIEQISKALPRYCYAGGRQLAGLKKRRLEEKKLFDTPVTPTTQTNDLEEVARRVIRGELGNGAERRTRLAAAGYDYNAVQRLVNKLLKGD